MCLYPCAVPILRTGRRITWRLSRQAAIISKIFQENRPNVSCYVTPYGQMIVGVTTDRIKINEGPDHLKIQIDYTLELNYEQTSQSHIEIDVKSKATAKLNLKEQ